MVSWDEFEVALLIVLRVYSFDYQIVKDRITRLIPKSDRSEGALRGKLAKVLEKNSRLQDCTGQWQVSEVSKWLDTLRLTPKQRGICQGILDR